MRSVAVALVLAVAATVNSAWAADYPKAYESIYEMTIAGGDKEEIHAMSDGKGHGRTETTTGKGETTIILEDYPKNTMFTIMDMNGQKRSMKSNLPDYVEPEPWQKGCKELGAKVIDNHPCHGFEKTYPNGQITQMWFDDKTQTTIMTETMGSDPKIISKLKLWANTAPSFSMELPGDSKPYP